MDNKTSPFETLKQIMRNARQPDLLDDHPWTQSLIVQEARACVPELAQASPGQQLVWALSNLFPQLQPANPPRRGKRLDPRWGEFGLLAALYFAPYNNGKAYPTTLGDAWGRIDPAVLYFVYGKPVEELGAEQIEKYELVGEDIDYAATSTLSDWHKKGLQRFTEIVLNRERFLSRTAVEPSIILHPEAGSRPAESGETKSPVPTTKRSPRIKRWLWVSALLLLVVLGLGGFKGWRIYTSGMLVYQDMVRLQGQISPPIELDDLNAGIPVMESLRRNLSAFKTEVGPLLWLSPYLKWIPTYGQDVAAGPALLDLTEHLLNASILSYQVAQPLLNELGSQGSSLTPAGLTLALVQAQHQLQEARGELDQALTARETIKPRRLSSRLSGLLVGQLDPVLRLADEGLSMATALPSVLGAGPEGPRTYMLLVQNEDELRATGGFITSVGKMVVHNGEVINLTFESVDQDVQEDWSQPYPAAPWQLNEYMDSGVLILRDSNWFTDFPTTVLWAEYLYAYTHSHSVDGVIAFDQHFLVMLLDEIGSIQVDGTPHPITPENVIEYMRQSKIRPPDAGPDWDRKDFIGDLAGAVLSELSGGGSRDWKGLATLFSRALAERHLLLQFDDPVVAELLSTHGWDNAVRPGKGDFLMVVDTNIGFNKTNAIVDTRLTYDVDLHDPASPRSTLVVFHKNNADKHIPCRPATIVPIVGETTEYPTNRCYWNYLRVYKQKGSQLLDATPQAILGGWMINGKSIPPRVDELEEDIPDVQGFGTLQVIRGGQSLGTSFEFALPPGIITSPTNSNVRRYSLKVQKQPGTQAIPITIRIHLPAGATLESVSAPAVTQGLDVLVETDLQTDVELEVSFSVP